MIKDGNGFSRRFLTLVGTNSLVFKVTLSSEITDNWLKPYVHYIPVEMDLSDLMDKIEWAKKHDDLARKIAENGQDFVKNHLRKVDFDCYMSRLFLEMATLMGIKE